MRVGRLARWPVEPVIALDDKPSTHDSQLTTPFHRMTCGIVVMTWLV